ncbi:hypothetical protein L7F22_007774, partial [Adiantum nelumboides]|nr:hypothetical protein [Adiantum nelumboides]
RDINLLESKLSCSLHYMSFFVNMMKQLANGCTLLLSPAFYAPEEGRTNREDFYSDYVACGWSDAEVAHHMSFETGRGYTENVVGVEEGNVFDLGIASPVLVAYATLIGLAAAATTIAVSPDVMAVLSLHTASAAISASTRAVSTTRQRMHHGAWPIASVENWNALKDEACCDPPATWHIALSCSQLAVCIASLVRAAVGPLLTPHAAQAQHPPLPITTANLVMTLLPTPSQLTSAQRHDSMADSGAASQ